MGNSILHIVYATDSRYLFPTQVAAGSAIAWVSRRADICIDILDCGVSDKEWDKFEGRLRERLGNEFRLVRHKIDMRRYDGYQAWHNSKGLYARLELPNILTDVDWCVYADGDTLFTDDPLKLIPLFDNKYALLGHEDKFSEKQILWHKQHNLPFNCKKRICSGFLVMNLKWFRENDGVNRLFKFMADYPDVIYPDQDALNYVCRGYIGMLPDGWGCFSLLCDSVEDINCIHYTIERPWELKLMGQYMPFISSISLWFDMMAKVCRIHKWQCPGVGFWLYWAAVIKTRVFVFLFYWAKRMPLIGKRYERSLDRQWVHSRLNKYIARGIM